MRVADKIRAKARALGLTQKALLAKAGLGPSFLKDMDQNDAQSPRVESLRKLARVLGVSLAWFEEDYEPDAPDGGNSANDLVELPEYDVRISAGGGALIADESVRRTWGLPRPFLDSIGVNASAAAFCEVVGDSMAPTLLPGDLILLDLRARNPAVPAIYALWDSDATVVKRVERVPGAVPPRLRLISDNAAFTPYDVDAATVNVIGRVAWFGRRT